MKLKKRNTSVDYFNVITRKEILVIHFTAGGTLSGAEATLALPDSINVPYIMDRDGTVYEYFDPKKAYAYHTGVKDLCKKSIGLEIVNWGFADLFNGFYLPWTKNINQAIAPEQIVKVNPFRGKQYFEKLTREQEQALPEFIAMCMHEHPIIEIETHAYYNPRKYDFPPDFEQVYSIIREFSMCSKNAVLPEMWKVTDEIMNGQECFLTKKQIQSRINYLIKNEGWQNSELNRLIKYRNGK